MLSDFHFLRPWWLLAIVPVILCWYVVRAKRDSMHAWKSVIAPHLLPYLVKNDGKRSKFRSLDLVALACCVAAIATSGPTWYRAPTPFANDKAALAIVIKVTPSMLTEDVQPSRLARSVEKVHDLLKMRGNAKTSLIAYSGTAHLVMPATTDVNIIDTFAQSLDPKIMPVEGDAASDAMQLADKSLADTGGGSIWWLADDIPPEQIKALQAWAGKSSSPVSVLPMVASQQEADKVAQPARGLGMRVVPLSADDADVNQLIKMSDFQPAIGDDSEGRWADNGYWLTPLLAILLLPFFRRGTAAFSH